MERFASSPLPTTSEEEWRYGRIDDLDLDRYHPLPAAPDRPVSAPAALRQLIGALRPAAVVFVEDGRSVQVDGSDDAVSIVDAGEQSDGPGDGTWPLESADALSALNEAFATPVTVRIAPGSRPGGPVVVVHWLTQAASGAATFPRTRVEVGRGAEAGIVEVAASVSGVEALTVPVTEIEVGDAAVVDYLHLQQLGAQVWQLGRQASRVGRDATFTAAGVALGGDYARLRTDSSVVGQGGTTRLLAAYFGDGERTVDFRTTQDHRAPHTTSELLFKGAVANHSHAVYTGLIRVEKGARATNAFQTNRNLVLHEGARADSVPNLEIEDNDVRCSHASAVGPIDADQRFYLESRGVPTDAADRLITLGFLDEVLARMPFPPIVDHLRLALVDALDRAETAEAGR